MERVLTADEKIKRAEEIYQKRRENNLNSGQTRVNVGNAKKDYRLFKRMLIQIAICGIIYIAFYCIKNNNYIFSNEFIGKVKQILSYDININQTYENISTWISNIGKENKTEEVTMTMSEENNNETTQVEEILDAISQEEEVLSQEEETQNTSEQLTDAEIIKANYSIIKPLTGEITSRFGMRNPTTPTVPVYHTGIDIAANTGTVFVSAMSGTVVQVSGEGDYGNHIKIKQDDVITLYAHCSNIYVKEGDNIEQGQEIGEVGETGNATGPHLHFEIRKGERFVNPDEILEF